jgi:hypothetical protein
MDLQEIGAKAWQDILRAIGVKQELKQPYISKWPVPDMKAVSKELRLPNIKISDSIESIHPEGCGWSLNLFYMWQNLYEYSLPKDVMANAGIFIKVEPEGDLELVVLHESAHNLLFKLDPQLHYLMYHDMIAPGAVKTYTDINEMLADGIVAKVIGMERVAKRKDGLEKLTAAYAKICRDAVEGLDISQRSQAIEAQYRIANILFQVPASKGFMPEIDAETYPYEKFFRKVIDGSWEEY